MAIYHLSMSVVSRGRGQRVVAAAAAQSGSSLRDEYYGVVHNHARRAGVEYREIIGPVEAPAWVFDREQLWNRVEARERRRDSQLARALEISLPVELTQEQRVELLRDYVRSEFVSQGMIADVCVRRTRTDNPNAYLLLTLRAAEADGFGLKMRHWNRKTNLLAWRASWADCANLHLARAGHRVRIDHRTLEAQQVDLMPAPRVGASRGEQQADQHQDRVSAQRRIAGENGTAIIADPAIAIRALARQQDTFTMDELIKFLASRTDGAEQLQAALASALESPELVAIDDQGATHRRFASKDMLEAEKSLLRRVATLTNRRHAQKPNSPGESPELDGVPPALHTACRYVVSEGDFKALALSSDEKAGFLHAMQSVWQARGTRVLHAMPASTDPELSHKDVVVLDRVELIELKILERILAVIERARAKVVLLADAERLAIMGPLSAVYAFIEPPVVVRYDPPRISP